MKLSILIPCHNEEKSIESCINSCLNQSRTIDEIVVVNDGSTDESPMILKKFGDKIKVIDIYPASGNKSFAQEFGLKQITGDVFIATDGDTILDRNFALRVEKIFSNETVTAMSGYVKSIKINWLTACRAFDYVIGQNLHKQAQSHLNFLMVIPGAAGAFRTNVFKNNVSFDHDTITEDLDFTYKLHKLKHKIVYDKKAIVYTQDPTNLLSYINQTRRWFGGGWQNLAKHLHKGMVDSPGVVLELSLIYIEGVIYSLLLYLVPLINFLLFLKILSLLMIVVLVQAIYASIKEKRMDIMIAVLCYPILMYINSYIFLEQFVKEFIFRRKNMNWFQPERVNI